MAVHPFPAEDLLQHPFPNYEREWRGIIVWAVVSTLVTLIGMPLLVKKWFAIKQPKQPESLSPKKPAVRTTTTTTTTKTTKKKRSKNKNLVVTPTTENDEDVTTEIHASAVLFLVFMNIGYFLFLLMLIVKSPNNAYAGRRVFVAPLLTEEECTVIIDMANQAAQRNYQSIQNNNENDIDESMQKTLLEPKGWKKDRHKSYPTTDLNVVLDFAKSDKQYLKQIFDTRLSPLIQRVYGVSSGSIRANDIFVVRYDEDGQQSLGIHTDSSHISFNILLNEEFEGGGTRFHNIPDDTFVDVKPKRGQVLLNNGIVPHEGLKTTKGTRYIMVGFMSLDVQNPITQKPSGLSTFASYLSLPWLLSTLKEGVDGEYSRDEITNALKFRTLRDVLRSIMICIKMSIEHISTMELTNLVPPSLEQDFIARLSTTTSTTTTTSTLDSNWFAGQNLYIGLDGTVIHGWTERENNPSLYDEI